MKKCVKMLVAAGWCLVAGAAEKNWAEDPYVGLVCDMIRCRPESRSPEGINKAQAVLRKFLREQGLYVVEEKFNGLDLTYAATLPTKTPEILLCAHIDVVPGTDKQYEPYVRGGRLYGRGADDDLGSVAAAAKVLALGKGRKSLGCLFTSDEEVGGPSARYLVDRGYSATRMGVVLETMNTPKITYAHKGHSVYEVTARGKEGHSSQPWEFENALEKLMTRWAAFMATWENPTSLNDWRTSLQATQITADSDAPNRIPGTATITVSCRSVEVGEASGKLLERLQRETGLDVRLVRGTEPVNSPNKGPELDALRAAVAKGFGVKPEEVRLTRGAGATDMRHLQFIGKPVYLSGIAGSGAHSDCEWLDLASIDRLVGILFDLATDVK